MLLRMKNAKETIRQEDFDYAINDTSWDLGNNVLYDLCRAHPDHIQANEIIAKMWLVGRSYAAAIERGKNTENSSDNFYEVDVVNAMQNSGLDGLLASLPPPDAEPMICAPLAIKIHNALLKGAFKTLSSDRVKRSLASKYLHFHRLDLFYSIKK